MMERWKLFSPSSLLPPSNTEEIQISDLNTIKAQKAMLGMWHVLMSDGARLYHWVVLPLPLSILLLID